ncbi:MULTISPECIES: SCO2584 family spore wall biosynthesis protein [unclassified Streptomyces]|uniref:SCO2584 family spore wall biosynthesis protein n=1 Tax=unclassified Streptomyces TaxID=2593676 RepID=UPI0022B6FC52|nr:MULTISPECIES: hypothetical protein [unclassified Streptomyces]MCZ7414195.1 hypothetical protein [Streptomyces sp. WMMC897]MCZ7431213.1 hypothetical protein [Streptomyces sp. WMMC1477]
MSDEATGRPPHDGGEPDDRDHGAAEDAFASVVFDEDFIRAAPVHEPTAAERRLAAARAEAEAAASREDGYPETGPGADEPGYGGHSGYGHDESWGPAASGRHPRADGAYAQWARARRADGRGAVRWYRPVAWLLALVMGIGLVATAFAAVQRSGSGQREEPSRPPASSEPEGSLGAPAPPAPGAAAAAAPRISPTA